MFMRKLTCNFGGKTMKHKSNFSRVCVTTTQYQNGLDPASSARTGNRANTDKVVVVVEDSEGIGVCKSESIHRTVKLSRMTSNLVTGNQ